MNHINKWWNIFVKDIMKSKSFFWTFVLSASSLVVIGFVSLFSHLNIGYKTSTFTHWYIKNETVMTKKSPYRGLASATPEFACMSDGIRVENLKKDVEYLESQKDSGKGVKGHWRGIQLETLPTPQAQFLLDHDKFISSQFKTFSDCIDLPCVLNKIYQDQSGHSGWLSYYWYLKTGTMLSMSARLNGVENDQNLDAYLFTKEELIKFWKLANSLPQSFLHLPGLKTIHKIPEGQTVEGFPDTTCSFSLPRGELLFKSACLSDEKNQFFIEVASAMAKQVDLNSKVYKSFSLDEEWLHFAKWQNEEYWFENYQTYAQSWFSESPANFFTSKDAQTHPTRHFSGVLANLRYNPDVTAELDHHLVSYMSEKFLDSHLYNPEGVLKKYLRLANVMWNKNESVYWTECLDKHFTTEHIDRVGTSKKTFEELNSKLFACMEMQIPAFVSDVLTTIKKENYEGCDFFNLEKYQPQSEKFLELVSKNINKRIFKVHFDLDKWGVQLLIGLKVKNEIAKKIDPTNLYINCYFHPQQESCFENRVQQATVHLANKFKQLHPEYLKQLIGEVQNNFRFDDVKEISEEKAKNFLFPYYASLREQSEKIWASCKKKKLSSSEKFDFPMSFSAGHYSIHPTLLNCINDDIDEISAKSLKQPLIVQNSEGSGEYEFTLQGQEMKYAIHHLDKRVHQYFKEFVSEEAEAEKRGMNAYFSNNADKIISSVIQSKDFLKEIYSKIQVEERCFDQVKSFYPPVILFHSEAQITGDFGKKICQNVMDHNQVKSVMSQSIENEWKKNRDFVISSYKETYQVIIDRCYNRYPSGLSINLIRNSELRKECMQEGHEEAVTQAFHVWSKEDKAKYFRNMELDLKKELHVLRDTIVNDNRKTDRVISGEK